MPVMGVFLLTRSHTIACCLLLLTAMTVSPVLALPPPPATGNSMLSTVPFVHVEQYRFEGNTVVSDSELQAIALPYTARKISARELFELKNAITRHYIDKGYINSGALLPDQEVTDGIITFRIIEGRLTDITITGIKRIRDSYILSRVDHGLDHPFNIIELKETLQLLQQDPLVKRLDGELVPGLSPGEAALNIDVSESSPFGLTARFANDNTPAAGEIGLELNGRYLNVSGRGDTISGRFRHTQGSNEYTARYSIPFNAADTRMEIFYDHGESSIIEAPFDLIDITSKTRTMGLSLTHPFIKTLSRELSLTLRGEKRRSETFLFDRPYSFSDNITGGITDITVGRLSMDWTAYRSREAFALRAVLSCGLDILDAGHFLSEPDGEFTSLLGQAQWSRRLELVTGDLLILKASAQLASDGLPSMERFGVGGFNTVRGYRENQFVRDNGLTASAEYRFPVARIPVPVVSRDLSDGMLLLAPFLDYGRSWNKNSVPGTAAIFSAGTGIRWDLSKNLHARVYWGMGIKTTGETGNDIQDSGVYFSITWDII